MRRKQIWVFGKVVVASAFALALVSIPARRLAPGLNLLELAGLLLGAFVALVALAVASLTFWQFILRAGGTDTQWFWFSGEPPGRES